MMKRILFFALAAIALTACEKEDIGDDHDHDHNHSNDLITITFATPNENETFDFNEIVTVSGTISRASEVHGYTVELINQTNQAVLYVENVHSHGNQLQINETWTNMVSDTTTVLVRVTALGDHEGTTSEVAERTITCNAQ